MATLLALLCWTLPVQGEKIYTLGVLPRYSPVKMYQRLSPLASYLQKKLGVQLEVRPYSSFDSFLAGAKKGEMAISFEDPVIALKLAPQMEPLAVVVGKVHGARTRGMVVVPKNSRVQRLRDLEGEKVAIVSFLSAAGFVSEAVSFADSGINPFTFLQMYQAVRNSQENVLLDVAMGNAAAGFLEEETGKRLIENLSLGNSIRILGYTWWTPRWTISVRSDLPKQRKIDLLNALLVLPEGDPALKALEITGFMPAYKVDFDSLASQLERLDDLKRGE